MYAEKNNIQDFADKILELLDDPDQCNKMGEFGRNRVLKELSWEYEEPKLYRAYDTLFDS